MSMKNSSDTIGNRTRDLPTCSAVPQPTAPPRALHSLMFSVMSGKNLPHMFQNNCFGNFAIWDTVHACRVDFLLVMSFGPQICP